MFYSAFSNLSEDLMTNSESPYALLTVVQNTNQPKGTQFSISTQKNGIGSSSQPSPNRQRTWSLFVILDKEVCIINLSQKMATTSNH